MSSNYTNTCVFFTVTTRANNYFEQCWINLQRKKCYKGEKWGSSGGRRQEGTVKCCWGLERQDGIPVNKRDSEGGSLKGRQE